MDNYLIIGAAGQIGTELVASLRQHTSSNQVIASDIHSNCPDQLAGGPYVQLDVRDGNALVDILKKYKITHLYHLAALLSAKAEQEPALAWQLNLGGYTTVLDAALSVGNIQRIFFPSSIAAFGPSTPRENTPQVTVMDPSTIYGITKLAGERISEYYFRKHRLDIRSIRYPGIISYKTAPGGGTTDYAVMAYHSAVQGQPFHCFLQPHTTLPMLYMPDAVAGTLQLMEAPSHSLSVRSSYNLAGFSFSPQQQADAIAQLVPGFSISFTQADFRQAIADSWPASIDDSVARADWGWKPQHTLHSMSVDMLDNLAKMYQNQAILQPSH